MNKVKNTLKILSTNWVHFVGFYVTTYLSLILFKLIGIEGSANEEWNAILFLSLLTIPLLFFVYGLRIIGGFLIAIILLDIISFNLKTSRIKLILLIEWLLIIPPFINWAFEYEYWLWITLSISFLITQLFRKRKITKIIKK
ncbi:hypothetical protein [Gillisia sp. JM1]|uniref:hypothetical protein n=1 Tax=Gillisia sp. JM1 TaxID=1283286 RepID=UPI00040BCD1C|nr:hypothetical protein [Gillisia sp. JM1]